MIGIVKSSDNVKNQLLLVVKLQPDCATTKSQSLHFASIEILNVPHDASESCLIIGRQFTVGRSPANYVQMPLAGLVLNRVTLAPRHSLSAEEAIVGAERLDREGVHAPTAALLRMHAERMRTAERQRGIGERFTAAHPGVAQAVVPALADDVHDLAGLREVAELLATQGDHQDP